MDLKNYVKMKPSDYPDSSQKIIITSGGIVCWIFIAYSLITMLILTLIGGPLDTIEKYFSMLQENKIIGLLQLDILTVFVFPLYYLLFFSLFIVLKKANYGLVKIATILIFAGVTLFISISSVFSYLNLSEKFASASLRK
jgi:hypothetical protein